MEAEQLQDLQSASWRPRRANGVILILVQRPGNKESQSISSNPSPSSKAGDQYPRSVVKQQKFLPPQALWSILAFNGLDETPFLLHSVYQFKC